MENLDMIDFKSTPAHCRLQHGQELLHVQPEFTGYDYLRRKQHGGKYQVPCNLGYSKPPVHQDSPYDFAAKPVSYTQ